MNAYITVAGIKFKLDDNEGRYYFAGPVAGCGICGETLLSLMDVATIGPTLQPRVTFAYSGRHYVVCENCDHHYEIMPEVK